MQKSMRAERGSRISLTSLQQQMSLSVFSLFLKNYDSNRQMIIFTNFSQLNLIEDKLYVWAMRPISSDVYVYIRMPLVHRTSFACICCMQAWLSSHINVSIQVQIHLFSGERTKLCVAPAFRLFSFAAFSVGPSTAINNEMRYEIRANRNAYSDAFTLLVVFGLKTKIIGICFVPLISLASEYYIEWAHAYLRLVAIEII